MNRNWLKKPASIAWKLGPLISDDAGTVAHLYWRNGALVDTVVANSWTMNGVVPQVAESGYIPPGAGSFSSSSTSYTLGAGPDVLDFAGDFSAAFIFLGSASGVNRLAGNGDGAAVGWEMLGSNVGAVRTWPTGTIANGGATNAGVPNVVFVGRTGTTLVAQVNSGAYTTAAGATIATAPAVIACVGANRVGGTYFNSVLYELWLSTTAPSAGLASSVISAASAKLHI